jgi:hypothetical protein
MNLRHAITEILWLLPLALQTAVIGVILRRRLARAFPVFLTYTVVVVARDLVLLFIPYATNFYSLVYWSGEGLAVLLGLGVIVEILEQFVRPFHFLKPALRAIWILAGVASLAALGILFLAGGGTGADRVLEYIVQLERALRFLQVSLLLIVLSLMRYLHLAWHEYALGILVGFGIYAALDLVALEFRAHLHFLPDGGFVLVRPAAYNLAAIIWASHFFKRRREEPPPSLPNGHLDGLNATLTEYVDQCSRRF